jgi:hypothetical protein
MKQMFSDYHFVEMFVLLELKHNIVLVDRFLELFVTQTTSITCRYKVLGSDSVK